MNSKEFLYNKNHIIKITFNSNFLEEFDKYDSLIRPRRKKRVLDWCGSKRLGSIPLINKFLNVANRQQQNQMKQQFHEYTKFILKKIDLDRDYLDRCGVVVKHYLPTKSKFDLDGIFVKPAFDAMSDFGVWEDDNYTVVEPIIFTGGHDKENPRTEILVFPITEEYDRKFVISCMVEELTQN